MDLSRIQTNNRDLKKPGRDELNRTAVGIKCTHPGKRTRTHDPSLCRLRSSKTPFIPTCRYIENVSIRIFRHCSGELFHWNTKKKMCHCLSYCFTNSVTVKRKTKHKLSYASRKHHIINLLVSSVFLFLIVPRTLCIDCFIKIMTVTVTHGKWNIHPKPRLSIGFSNGKKTPEEGRLDYSYRVFIRKLNAYTVPRYLLS